MGISICEKPLYVDLDRSPRRNAASFFDVFFFVFIDPYSFRNAVVLESKALRGTNRIYPEGFSGFNFTTDKVVNRTAMIMS